MVSAFVPPPVFELLQARLIPLVAARVVRFGKLVVMMVMVVVVVADVVLFTHPTRIPRPGREHDEVHPPVEYRTSIRQESREASSRIERCDVVSLGRVALTQQLLVA